MRNYNIKLPENKFVLQIVYKGENERIFKVKKRKMTSTITINNKELVEAITKEAEAYGYNHSISYFVEKVLCDIFNVTLKSKWINQSPVVKRQKAGMKNLMEWNKQRKKLKNPKFYET